MHEGFNEAIAANPHDSTPHHVYADYLEEMGSPEEARAHRILALAKEGREDPKLGLTLETAAKKVHEARKNAYDKWHVEPKREDLGKSNEELGKGDSESAKAFRVLSLAQQIHQQVIRNKQHQIRAKGYSDMRGPVGIKENAELLGHGQTLYHHELRNRRGQAVRARVNGKVKTWKTRPQDFSVPMVHGLYGHFYLTPRNAHEWLIHDPTQEEG